jgi:hypothetical protein
MRTKQGIVFGIALAIMLGGAGGLWRFKTDHRLGPPGLKLDLPRRVLDYDSTNVVVAREELATLPKDTEFARRLYTGVASNQPNHLLVSIVLMGTDRTSIHKPQFCLTGQGWQIEKSERVTIAIARPHKYALPVMKLTANKQIQTPDGQALRLRGLYVYWFVADKSITAEHWQRMWWMARHLLRTGVLQRWAYVSCFTTCLPGQEEAAFERMEQFIAAAAPEFQLATGSIE